MENEQQGLPFEYMDNNQNLMRIRLDNSDILLRIQEFLSGQRITQERQRIGEGQYEVVTKVIQLGKEKMNQEGIQSIMAWLNSILTPMVVQGNFSADFFLLYIRKFHRSLIYNLVLNSERWSLSDNDIELVFDEIIYTVVPFMSRLIQNKERESYNTLMSRETVVQHESDLSKKQRGIMK